MEACLQALTRAAVDVTDQGQPECPEAALGVLRLTKACPELGHYLLHDRNSVISSKISANIARSSVGGIHGVKIDLRQKIHEIVEGNMNQSDTKFSKNVGRHVPRRPATGMSGRIRGRMGDRKFVSAGSSSSRRTAATIYTKVKDVRVE